MAVAGILIAFFALSYVATGYGVADAYNASAASAAGVEDALLQLDRNADFSNTTGYTVSSGANSATVTVTQNSPSAGLATVVSSATVSGHTSKTDVVVSVNAATGQTNVVSWVQVQ